MKTTDLRTAAQQALEALEQSETTVRYEGFGLAHREAERKHQAAITSLRAALAQEQAEPDAYGYASRLATSIWERHYKGEAPNWKPLDDLMGVLTQIDNMTTGLTRQGQEQAEPVAWLQPKTVNAYSRPDLGYESCSSADYGAFPVYRALPRCPNCASLEAQNDELDRKLAEMERAEPSQEPVAWLIDYEDGEREVRFVAGTRGITQTPLYAAAPTAKPVAWMTDRKEMYFDKDDALRYSDSIIQPLYLAPPQRKPLTEEKIDAEWRELDGEVSTMFMRVLRKFARAIERAHGIGEAK